MAITNKLGEHDITDAVMYALLDASGSLDTSTIKSKVRDLLEPAGPNRKPLLHRNDEAIDQIIRNIVSHRFESSNNIIYMGYVNYDDGYWELTEKGRQYLRTQMKNRFTNELN